MIPLERDQIFTLASPFPYVVATVLGPNDRPNAIGLAWWTFCSWEPLHLAISVGSKKYSAECLARCPEFVLHFPSTEQAASAWLCGRRSGRAHDKLAESGFELVPSLEVKPPTLEGATVALECRVEQTLVVGDHTLFLGPVVASRGTPEALTHLYSLHYTSLVGIGSDGSCDWGVGKRLG
jgi:flavin reductase (DIM6/NTAB) family NADH-FMN oxidoreductase RutF